MTIKYPPLQQESYKNIHPCSKTTTEVSTPEEGWSRWFCKAKCPHGPHSPDRGLHTDSYQQNFNGPFIQEWIKNQFLVTVILGIFTVVSKKGDGFSLGPRNVNIRTRKKSMFHHRHSMFHYP